MAFTELQPCAIFANGPPCTNAGFFSRVCTIFGLITSFKSAATAPVHLSWPKVTFSLA